MYLDAREANGVVRDMLRRAKGLLALSGPASPGVDNGLLAGPVLRERDGSFIHNFDTMVANAGGTVVGRRWEGSRVVDGHTIYFVFAKP